MTKTIILSDIHFCKRGSSIASVDQLRPLWNECDTLILNGDTAEMYSRSLRVKSKEMMQLLIKLAGKDNVTTIVICGNHDPTISDIQHVWLCGERVLVFHGDVQFKGVTPWSWRGKHIAKCRQECIKESGDGFHEQFASLRTSTTNATTGKYTQYKPSLPHMMLLSFPCIFNVFYGWWRFPTLTNQWVERYAPSAKIIIAGHTHHAGIWKRDGRIIINTGCFGVLGFPSRPRAVVIDNNMVTVHTIRRRGGNYVLGRKCGSWEAL